MMAVPEDTPVTIPVEPMVAIAGLPLLQAPPGEVSDSIIEDPAQTLPAPEIAGGSGFTVISLDAVQPAPRV